MGLFTVHNQGGGSIFFQNAKVTCILLYNLWGCLYFPLKHKSAMYTFYNKGGGGGGGVGNNLIERFINRCYRIIC